jgi:ribonucleoside-diphosphate reductase alpha chain
MIESRTKERAEREMGQPDISLEVLKRRCLLKDGDGHAVETPDQMYWRVAKTVAEGEAQYGTGEQLVQLLPEIFYKLMASGEFLPNSPTLMNAGQKEGLLSACFVLPVNDSIIEIFEAIRNTALIQKAGGGTGFAFDKLRPTGDRVASSGGTTSGPVSFWRVIAETTNAIQQGAHRRGANMGMMDVGHPDILKFIYAKQDQMSFNNFNISVKIPDSFMNNVYANPNASHMVTNPRTQQRYAIPRTVDLHTYHIQDLRPFDEHQSDCFTVLDLWKMIITNAHATGEPGVCYIDRVNEDNPTPALGTINATNPCGEQPLLDFEACNLGSLNVSKFVLPDMTDLNWQALGQSTEFAVRFLDDVIDVNHWPISEIRDVSLGNRKIGLGIMGFADTLVLLGIRYDSDEAVDFARRLSGFIQDRAHKASQKLAQQRGCFPNWKYSVWDTEYHTPMRNAACTTIAPTGSISLIAKCSSGIEPIFKPAYKRRALDGVEFVQLHPLLEQLGAEQGWLNERIRAQLRSGIDLHKIGGVPQDLAEIFVTAHEIAPEWHVRIQAAFQSNVDNAVSKTVNLPADATVEDVDRIFKLAYKSRCKGNTVYRDNSRDNQVILAIGIPDGSTSSAPRPRPRVTFGQTSKFRMGCGTLFVTVNRDGEGICEVFANLGKAGGCPSQTEATCRAVSAALRSGVDPRVMIDQLHSIRCMSAAVAKKSNKAVDVLSCPDAIARALQEALASKGANLKPPFQRTCEECGHPMRWEARCSICDFCGHSDCS